MKLILLAAAALLLAGCDNITMPAKKETAQVATASTKSTTSVELERTRYLALAYIAKNSTDASTKHMAVMALALAAPK